MSRRYWMSLISARPVRVVCLMASFCPLRRGSLVIQQIIAWLGLTDHTIRYRSTPTPRAAPPTGVVALGRCCPQATECGDVDGSTRSGSNRSSVFGFVTVLRQHLGVGGLDRAGLVCAQSGPPGPARRDRQCDGGRPETQQSPGLSEPSDKASTSTCLGCHVTDAHRWDVRHRSGGSEGASHRAVTHVSQPTVLVTGLSSPVQDEARDDCKAGHDEQERRNKECGKAWDQTVRSTRWPQAS